MNTKIVFLLLLLAQRISLSAMENKVAASKEVITLEEKKNQLLDLLSCHPILDLHFSCHPNCAVISFIGVGPWKFYYTQPQEISTFLENINANFEEKNDSSERDFWRKNRFLILGQAQTSLQVAQILLDKYIVDDGFSCNYINALQIANANYRLVKSFCKEKLSAK